MTYFTRRNNSWLRKTTATGLVPILLAQASIALLCVPETLNAGTQIRREMAWKALTLLNGERNVTITLDAGGGVQGDVVMVLENGIHLHHITRATDRERYPLDSDALIARSDVKEIRMVTLRGSLRWAGALGLGLGGFFFGPSALGAQRWGDRVLAGWAVGSVGGATLGYWLGKRKDRETTIITITD